MTNGHQQSVNRGALVAIEGLDGAGKSTQVKRLGERLAARGYKVVVTREPTEGTHGQRIRELATHGQRATAEEELRLFQEDRAEHLVQVIAPALALGSVVISDRYTLSSVAYQGARGLDPAAILEESEARFPLPDIAVILELGPALGLERVRERGEPLVEAFERLDLLRAVAEVFRSIDRPYVARIDASQDADAVHEAILAAVLPVLLPA